jgi:GR25 family glycosyltransferase involved in LPS biosynthesis
MTTKIKVFVLSLKNSKRTKLIKKRLKDIKINFKILYGINGKKKINYQKLEKLYNKKKTQNYIGRQLSYPEIAASYAHISAYKIIIKKKIKSAIIMEDDIYPSKALKCWIKNNVSIKNNYILGFYSYPALGFVYKKAKKIIANCKIKIHDSRTHLFNGSCYQININTCKKILKFTNGKVSGFSDWPFNLKKNKINLGVTLPYLNTFFKNISYTSDSRNEYDIKLFKFTEKFPDVFQAVLRFFYYISYLSFFVRKYSNVDFYNEQFFSKYFVQIKNLFTNKYYNTKKIFFDKNFYFDDLQIKVGK